MKNLEILIERTLLGCRWILVVFYLGLAVGLAAYAVNFVAKVYGICSHVLGMAEEELLLSMLALVDGALVAGLTVMVMIAGYENFVSRFDQVSGASDLAWLGKLDAGALKLKVAAAIVAISSISLLQVFLNVDKYTEWQVRAVTVIHAVFVLAALLLGLAERLPAIWRGDAHE